MASVPISPAGYGTQPGQRPEENYPAGLMPRSRTSSMSAVDDASSIFTYREFLSNHIFGVGLDTSSSSGSSTRTVTERSVYGGIVVEEDEIDHYPSPPDRRFRDSNPQDLFYRLYIDDELVRSRNEISLKDPTIGRLSGHAYSRHHSVMFITRQILKAENLDDEWTGVLFADAFHHQPMNSSSPIASHDQRPGIDIDYPLAIILTRRIPVEMEFPDFELPAPAIPLAPADPNQATLHQYAYLQNVSPLQSPVLFPITSAKIDPVRTFGSPDNSGSPRRPATAGSYFPPKSSSLTPGSPMRDLKFKIKGMSLKDGLSVSPPLQASTSAASLDSRFSGDEDDTDIGKSPSGRIKSRKSTTWASFKGREKANSPISPGLQAPPTPALFVFPTRVDEERYKLRARARCNIEYSDAAWLSFHKNDVLYTDGVLRATKNPNSPKVLTCSDSQGKTGYVYAADIIMLRMD